MSERYNEFVQNMNDILTGEQGASIREIAKAAIDEVDKLMNRLDLAVCHMGGDECPDCHQDSVVSGCSGSCCVLCDWEHDLNGGFADTQMTINFENHCFWHSDCTSGKHSSPMKELFIDGEKKHTLMECCGCGATGFYPHGKSGSVIVNRETDDSQS